MLLCKQLYQAKKLTLILAIFVLVTDMAKKALEYMIYIHHLV